MSTVKRYSDLSVDTFVEMNGRKHADKRDKKRADEGRNRAG